MYSIYFLFLKHSKIILESIFCDLFNYLFFRYFVTLHLKYTNLYKIEQNICNP